MSFLARGGVWNELFVVAMILATHVVGDRTEVQADLCLRVLVLLLLFVYLDRLCKTVRAGRNALVNLVLVLILLIRVEIVQGCWHGSWHSGSMWVGRVLR